MIGLAALRHLGAVLHPTRRYLAAAQLVSGALELDRVAQPIMTASLSEAGHEVGAATEQLLKAVRTDNPTQCAIAAAELTVAALRLSAELPDPFRISFDRAYLCVQEQAWAELTAANEAHPRPWVSLHEGLGVVLEEVVELGEAIDSGDTGQVRLEAIQVAAMGIRFLADLTPIRAGLMIRDVA